MAKIDNENGVENVSGGEVGAIMALPPQLAIMKMENDTIQALAAAHPRDFEGMKTELAAQLKAFPELAADAIYNKPVGREDDKCGACGEVLWRKKGRMAESCFKCQSGNIIAGGMKFAQGLSIRAAETLSEVYGYNRVRADVTPIDEFTVKVEATFTDYQRGRIWQDGGVVSRRFKKRNGDIDIIPEDRFHSVVVKAEKSKYTREVINRSINAGLKAWFWAECEKIAEGLLDDKTVDKIVAQFAGKGATLEMLERLLDKQRAFGWTKSDRLKLVGVWTALKEGETTINQAFGLDDQPAPSTSKATRSPMADELSKPAANGHDTPADASATTAAEQRDAVNADLKKQLTDWREFLKTQLAASKNLTDVNVSYDATVNRFGLVGDDLSEASEACEVRSGDIREGRGGKAKQKEMV